MDDIDGKGSDNISKIVSLRGVEDMVTLDKTLLVDPEQVVSSVPASKLEKVIVVGKYPDGTLYIASSHNAPEAVFTLQRAVAYLLESEE